MIAALPMSATRELDLENHAEILLIHFNNPNKVKLSVLRDIGHHSNVGGEVIVWVSCSFPCLKDVSRWCWMVSLFSISDNGSFIIKFVLGDY